MPAVNVPEYSESPLPSFMEMFTVILKLSKSLQLGPFIN